MLGAILIAAAVSATPANSPVAEKLDRWLVASDFKGSVLVYQDGAVLLRKGYGMADRENGVPYDAETVFDVGSITKQFTAAAILKLETQGKLRVEDTVGKFFPEAPGDKRGITLHQLLTHSSGLESDFAKDYDPMQRDEYAKRILASKLRAGPGESFFYANSGYSLLGAIVEIVSGMSYEKYLRENIFLPAGMKDTGYKLPAWPQAKIAVGYNAGKRWGRITEKPWASDGPYWALRANGGLHSTLDDMLRWHKALSSDTVLSAAARAKMFTGHMPERAGDSAYGYGWSIGTSVWDSRLIEHNGGNGTFYADFLRYVDDDMVVILSTNDSEVKGGRISHALGRLVHGDDVPVARAQPSVLVPLSSEGRDALIKAWFEAYNAKGVEGMHAFRAAHQAPRPGVDDAEADRRLGNIRKDLGKLTPEGIVGATGDDVTVRAKSSNGPVATLKFMFASGGKLAGIGIEVGQ